ISSERWVPARSRIVCPLRIASSSWRSRRLPTGRAAPGTSASTRSSSTEPSFTTRWSPSPVRLRWGPELVSPPNSVKALALFVVTPNGIVEHPLPPVGRFTIGRGEGNTLRIDDPSVSRRHAALEIGDALRIEDLGGANGTHVQRASHLVDQG